jgi:hypothetical protein
VAYVVGALGELVCEGVPDDDPAPPASWDRWRPRECLATTLRPTLSSSFRCCPFVTRRPHRRSRQGCRLPPTITAALAAPSRIAWVARAAPRSRPAGAPCLRRDRVHGKARSPRERLARLVDLGHDAAEVGTFVNYGEVPGDQRSPALAWSPRLRRSRAAGMVIANDNTVVASGEVARTRVADPARPAGTAPRPCLDDLPWSPRLACSPRAEGAAPGARASQDEQLRRRTVPQLAGVRLATASRAAAGDADHQRPCVWYDRKQALHGHRRARR